MEKIAKIKNSELTIEGVAASPGIAIGRVYLLGGDAIKVDSRTISEMDVDEEISKFKTAIEKTKGEIQVIRTETKKSIGEKSARVFDAHLVMLDDEALIDASIFKIEKEHKNAALAFNEVIEEYEQKLYGSKNEYFKDKVFDLRDVKRRLVRNIQGGRPTNLEGLNGASVIVAKDMTPSDTVALDKQKVMAMATDLGSRTSHAAIMARALEVPSVVALKEICTHLQTGDQVVVDGYKGLVILNPQPNTIEKYNNLKDQHLVFEQNLRSNRTLPARTKDGKDIELSANIEFQEEIEAVIACGASGIGLYRTENLYLSKSQWPTEEEQYREYMRVVEEIYPNTVIIRTVDVGGDKMPESMDIQPEENPFLGLRAIRLCLEKPEFFETQLRAILRASVKGNVKILFPMISSLQELRQSIGMLNDVKTNLSKTGVPFDNDIEVGVMVEVPSAALIADMLAAECDFLTIGTNDLTQYALAVDRGNDRIAHLYRTMNPAILRLIRNTIELGHSQGVWVGMCGEMAGDPLATMLLLGLGLDEFSVSPIVLPKIKEIIRRVEISESERLADKTLDMRTVQEVEDYLQHVMKVKFKDLPLWD